MSHFEMIMTKGEPDAERKSCIDCYHCRGAISWWCYNEDARKHRGTNIAGGVNCKFWKACRKYGELSFWEKYGLRLTKDFIYFQQS